jgi:hypothetical protein
MKERDATSKKSLGENGKEDSPFFDPNRYVLLAVNDYFILAP